MQQSRFLRGLQALELEERILNAGALVALVGVFLPWMGGDWLGGDSVSYNGLGFYTSFMGFAILALNLFILLIAIVPLAGGPIIIRKRHREFVRLCASAQSVILVLCSLTVLMRVTFEFTRMEMYFGIYVCLIGSIVALFEAVLRYLEQRKAQVQEMFHHPEDQQKPERAETYAPPPPPPPPPPPAPAPEEHRLYP